MNVTLADIRQHHYKEHVRMRLHYESATKLAETTTLTLRKDFQEDAARYKQASEWHRAAWIALEMLPC